MSLNLKTEVVNCMGPQSGDPLCPCQMQILRDHNYDADQCELNDILCEVIGKPRMKADLTTLSI